MFFRARFPRISRLFLLACVCSMSDSIGGSVQSQFYAKVFPESRFQLGVVIAEFRARGLSAPKCAATCQRRIGQSFNFGCDLTELCSCRVYKNVPPSLQQSTYFQPLVGEDYYEIKLAEEIDYSFCMDGASDCVGGAFCKRTALRLRDADGTYKLISGNVCYKPFLNATGASSWQQAKSACNAEGGKLAEPVNSDEQQLLLRLMRRMDGHPNYGQSALATPSVWIGCSGKTPFWKWQDGTDVTVTFWNGNNPDSIRDVNCCASLYRDVNLKTFWIDRNCDDKTAFVCVYAPCLPAK